MGWPLRGNRLAAVRILGGYCKARYCVAIEWLCGGYEGALEWLL